MSEIDVTVSLIALNQIDDLKRLLPTLIEAVAPVSAEILLVINRSKDGTEEYVRRYFPLVDMVDNQQVSGYGENHNINLNRAKGRFFLIMNSDMTVSPAAIKGLKEYMEKHSEVGIVSPLVFNEDGSIQGLNKRHPTILDLFLRRFVPGRWRHLFQKRLDYYEMRDLGYENECEVPFLSGAFMFCRTDVIRTIGGFDPRFFLYFEDADLCRRVQKTHTTMFYPIEGAVHFWARAAHKRWKFSWIFIKSAFKYFNRWGYQWF